MEHSDAEVDSLRRYRLLRKRFLLVLAAYFPAVAAMAAVSWSVTGEFLIAYYVALALCAVLAVMWIRLSYWRCPACGGIMGWWPPLVAKCSHCGFPSAR